MFEIITKCRCWLHSTTLRKNMIIGEKSYEVVSDETPTYRSHLKAVQSVLQH